MSDTSAVVESALRRPRSPVRRLLVSRDGLFIGILIAFLLIASAALC